MSKTKPRPDLPPKAKPRQLKRQKLEQLQESRQSQPEQRLEPVKWKPLG